MSDIPTTHTLPEDALRMMRTAFRMDPRSSRCLEDAEDELTRLRDALAAAQEREQRMREALGRIRDETLLGVSHGLGDRIYSIASGAITALGKPQ